MGDELKTTDEARIEIHKAKCLFELHNKEDEFWEDFNRQIEMVLLMPEAFQVRYKNVRIITLEQFNYSIHYVIKPYGLLIYRFLGQRLNY
jgi:hypothetical protein